MGSGVIQTTGFSPVQNGESLTFPTPGLFDATSMVNDLAGVTVDAMTLTAGRYLLNGNALIFIQGVTDNHSADGPNIVAGKGNSLHQS